MRKYLYGFLTLFVCTTGYSLPVGNPSEASLLTSGVWWGRHSDAPCFRWWNAFSLRAGFYGDYVFNRNLRVRHPITNIKKVNETKISTSAGYLALNYYDWIDLFATLGGSKLQLHTDIGSFASSSFIGDVVFSSHFSWSIGARSILWKWNCFKIGIEGQYFSTVPYADYLVRFDTAALDYLDISDGLPYWEYQVGMGLSYTFKTRTPTVAFIPYIAGKWSKGHFELNKINFQDDAGTTFAFKNLSTNKEWGLAVGMTLSWKEMTAATVEGRWGDEKAVYVNGQFRF